jgi:hypothetical protein
MTENLFQTLNNGKIKEKYKDISVYLAVINDEYYDIPYEDIRELLALVTMSNIIVIESNKKMNNTRIECIDINKEYKTFTIVLSQDLVCDLVLNKQIMKHTPQSIQKFLEKFNEKCTKKLPIVPGCKMQGITLDLIGEQGVQVAGQIESGYFKTTHIFTDNFDIIPIKERPFITGLPSMNIEDIKRDSRLKNLDETIDGYKAVGDGNFIKVVGLVLGDGEDVESVMTNAGVHIPVSPSKVGNSRLPILGYKFYYDIDSHINDFINSKYTVSEAELYYIRYNRSIDRIHKAKVDLYRSLSEQEFKEIKAIVIDTNLPRSAKVDAITRILQRHSNEEKIILDYISTFLTNDTQFKFIKGLFMIESPIMKLKDNEELVSI